MNRKLLLLLLVLMAVSMGNISAQEYEGFIKPTWSAGLSMLNEGGIDYTLTRLGLDIDFVHSTGITFGLQNTMAWNDDIGAALFAAFGMGYTYDAGMWCAGAKVMAVPYEGGGIGINANGTWWFSESLGLTVIADYYLTMSDIDWKIVSIRAGISALF
jgi:hypothetical protein